MLKSEISNLQVEKSLLESRVSGLLSTRAGEKATLSSLEKKLADERKQKAEFQIKLETERKNKKEAASAERAMHQTQTRTEVIKLEAEIKTLRQELQMLRDRCDAAERVGQRPQGELFEAASFFFHHLLGFIIRAFSYIQFNRNVELIYTRIFKETFEQ